MYATVPSAAPGPVSARRSIRPSPRTHARRFADLTADRRQFGEPEIQYLGVASLVTKILAGLMSLNYALAVRASSASRLNGQQEQLLITNGLPGDVFEVRPSRYSMAMNAFPSCFPMS